MPSRFALFLPVFLLLAGCFEDGHGPTESGPFDLPTKPTGPPVAPAETASPTGTWYTSQEISGLTLWLVELDAAPMPAQWSFSWTPSQDGGFIAHSGVAFESEFGGELRFFPSSSWAQPSRTLTHQGHVESSPPSDPGLLVFAVHPFGARGTVEFMIEWSEGDARTWAPAFEHSGEGDEYDEYTLESGEAVNMDVAMGEFAMLHVMLPCTGDAVEQEERLDVHVGDDSPRAYHAEGWSRGNRADDWTNHVGLWTTGADVVPVHVAYEGPKTPTLAIGRSPVDLGSVILAETGYMVSMESYPGECRHEPRSR